MIKEMRIRIITTGFMILILGIMCCASLFRLGRDWLLQSRTDQTNAVHWSAKEEYPIESEATPSSDAGVIEKIAIKLVWLMDAIESSVGDKLIYKQSFSYAGNWLEAQIGWDADCVTDYNPTYRLDNNYIVGMKLPSDKQDIKKESESVEELKQYCENREITFLYLCLPNKLNQETDQSYDGIYAYGNSDADQFLNALNEKSVKYLDMRKEIDAWGGVLYRELFFDTDHHWKPQAGIRAANSLIKHLNKEGHYELSLHTTEINNYQEEIYQHCFLGSYGKKLTSAKVKPDDISLFYPKFQTKLTLEIPSAGLKKRGDFSVIYDYSRMNRQYNEASPYGAYMHGAHPIVKLYNHLAQNQLKVLVIKDSYSIVMVPFLALAVSQVDMLALGDGGFDGSVKSYIDKEKPEIVIVSYYVDNVGNNALFDFK